MGVRVPYLPWEVSLRAERRAHDPIIPVRVRGLPGLTPERKAQIPGSVNPAQNRED